MTICLVVDKRGVSTLQSIGPICGHEDQMFDWLEANGWCPVGEGRWSKGGVVVELRECNQ